MPTSYKIEQLGGKVQWEGDAMKGDYPATLSGHDGEVLIFHDASSTFDPPQVGNEVYGDIDKDKRGNARLRRKPKAKGGASNGGSASKGGSYNDPETIARITRSHSQEMALRFIAATGDAKELDLENTDVVKAYLNGHVKRLTDWFDRDVQSVSPPPSQPPLDQSSSDAPADTAGLEQRQTVPGDDVPF